MLKVISAPELAKNLDPILQALEESGTTLIIKHHDQPAALLVRFDAYVAMLATMDYSGWERWIDEVRMAFPTTVFSPPRRPKAIVPAFIDPADFAPGYMRRGTGRLPKQGEHEPWLNSQDYYLEKAVLPEARFDDGVLQFDNPPRIDAG